MTRLLHAVVLILAAALVIGGAVVGTRMLLQANDGEEAGDGVTGPPAVGCAPQPDRGQARMARSRFVRQQVRGAKTAWFVSASVADAESSRDRLSSQAPTTDPGALVGDGWVLVVGYHPSASLPTALPGCVASTPVLYLPVEG
ncbi:hypothetical protein FXB39_01195 [Nocardioides sp. BGMRC 2183]|nr:hypothetical protein FXB39_01195 [Nocardioides sp. BGMRC 2183]